MKIDIHLSNAITITISLPMPTTYPTDQGISLFRISGKEYINDEKDLINARRRRELYNQQENQKEKKVYYLNYFNGEEEQQEEEKKKKV